MYWNACAPIGTFGARWRERSEASAITIRIFPRGRIRLTSMGPGITAVRKNSVTHRKARGTIRDAIRGGSDWHGLHRIPRGDGANRPLGSRTTRAADRDPFRRAGPNLCGPQPFESATCSRMNDGLLAGCNGAGTDA